MKPAKNSLEWSVFAISALLIVALVATLIREATTEGDQPPLLRVTIGDTLSDGHGGHRIPITVRNDGDRTAAEAKIEVTLEEGGREVERGEVTLPFVPQQSSRTGWVVFNRDPRCCRLSARAVGYQQP
jgi:uncharacterized protein (TIGR02588 family)